ncbi:MAG: carboxypeptidase regulatory-like domain-containing protein [Deltaproteobacteria bacterium]|nr:carboxypeptidase regulatory-like domain-containing protein [Deltaproteobacteria bacterium]
MLVALAVVVVGGVLVARFARRAASPAKTATSAPALAAIHRAPGVVGIGAATTKGQLAHSDVGTLRLEGQVIDEQLQPIGGAQVTLFIEPPRKVTTEADGAFAFENLAPGPYRLVAHKDAQSSAIARARLSGTSELVTLRVRPGATIVVHVVAADGGAPIVGATVSDRARAIITGADGIARLGGMSEYDSVEVTAPGYSPAAFTLSKPEEPDGTFDRTVELARGAALSGTVVGPDGALIVGANVHVEGAASQWSGWAQTDANGAWSLPALAADKYSVTADSEIYAAADPIIVELDGKRPRTGLVVHVAVGAQLVGTVVDPNGRPVAGARVRLASEDGSSFDDVTEADGRFALLGTPTGTFWVWATTAAQATSRVEVLLVRDQRVEVHLVLAESSLAGSVVDTKGEPIADAVVMARTKLMVVGRVPSEVTDSRGAFDFGGVPAGEYQLTAQRPEQNDSRRLDGTKVTVPDRTVKLVVPDVSSITGRVLLDGQPMPYYGLIVTEHPEFSWQESPIAAAK